VPTTTLYVDLDLVTLVEPPKPASFLAVLVRQFVTPKHPRDEGFGGAELGGCEFGG
jgi:hypothetical protein